MDEGYPKLNVIKIKFNNKIKLICFNLLIIVNKISSFRVSKICPFIILHKNKNWTSNIDYTIIKRNYNNI